MVDALTLLKTRRSVAPLQLGEPGPSQAEIDEMLTIASRVPDHGKLAPWRFILFRGAGKAAAGEAIAALRTRKFPDTPAQAIDHDRIFHGHAPLVVGVVSRAAPHEKIPEFEQLLSAAAATMNLEIAAHAMGYAAQWLTEWIAYDDEAGRLLGLQEGERFVAFVHIGAPKLPPADRPRPALADIVSEWKPA